MTEKWLPAVHTLVWRVDVNPEDHAVTVDDRTYRVERVTLTYRRVANETDEWQDPVVVLRTTWARRREVYRAELDFGPPAWLLDIEARAQPMNP